MEDKVLCLSSLKKSYKTNVGELEILKGVDLEISSGVSVSVLGKSGSGKSTLLHTAALLIKKDSGKIYYNGKDSDDMSSKECSRLRNRAMGFMFQNSSLLEDFSSLENVMMPQLISGVNKIDARKRALELLKRVGLDERKDHLPSSLSGGERSRVSLCRSIVNHPSILFLDEPTGSLDERTSKEIETLILSLPKEEGISVLLVTHNTSFASMCNSVYTLKNGVLE